MENQKKTLTEIMARPLPEITAEEERELAELEELISKPATKDPRIKTLTEIMARPLPEITPEEEAEMSQLEELFTNKGG
ncbi:hypothetical protein [Nostoc sp. ATCC 53789]|uniref:hypothetical protein n=1 Tax=Nostoc sp. ATCC 53789 TaxID=76335 RepID=UPI000DECB9C1|nr:hypothetical protein [Nostoc sp. ATCC 53789]QHG15802.1 hypothetical protein GJB62_07345 [Nostoc sp. ATCC 53789]RCJ27759.1 hypothetical protein A6V25_17825 [Nostoc sp. ATCC 53789]